MDLPYPSNANGRQGSGHSVHALVHAVERKAAAEFSAVCVDPVQSSFDIVKVKDIPSCDSPTRTANAPHCVKGVMNLRGVMVPVVGSMSDVLKRVLKPINGAPKMGTQPDTRFITGIASTSDQMLHRMNIETQMSSANLGLMQTPTDLH